MMRGVVFLALFHGVLALPFRAWAQEAANERPSVREVVAMALKAARHAAPGRADELGRRARLAGLVPQLKFAARRGVQQDQSSTSTLSDDRTNASLGDDLTLEAGLTFQLDRLVFAPEQVRLLAVARWLASDRRKLIEDVVRLYYRRVRLLAERASAATEDATLDADVAEVEALLDAYTNGAFGAARETSGRMLAPPPVALPGAAVPPAEAPMPAPPDNLSAGPSPSPPALESR